MLLRKVVYPHKCTYDWGKFSETSFLEKEGFYNHLRMEDITDTDYTHVKKFMKILKL